MMSAWIVDAEVVGLAREIGRHVVVDLLRLEGVVAQVAPEDREHAEVVRLLEAARDLTAAGGSTPSLPK